MLYEFIVKVPLLKVDTSIEALNIAGLYNSYYEPPIEIVKVQNGYAYEQKEQEAVALKIYAEEHEDPNLPDSYFALIEKTLHISKAEIEFNIIDDSNWNYKLEDIDLGNGWIICYSGEVDKYPNNQVLRFEPQAAFGTGLHETTQDCLRVLLKENLSGKSLLDLGTGSGLLTIAAALKGAQKLVAVDYESVNREVKLNAELNDITIPIQVDQADLLTGSYQIVESFDWIVINIGADETVEILQRHNLLNKSRNFLISGVVEWNTDRLIQTFEQAGFSIKEKRQTNEWVTIHFQKDK